MFSSLADTRFLFREEEEDVFSSDPSPLWCIHRRPHSLNTGLKKLSSTGKLLVLANVDAQFGNVLRHTLLNEMKTCQRTRNLLDMRSIHAHVVEEDLEHDAYIATSLITTYAKCGDFYKAQSVLLRRIPEFDVRLWNALISGYVRLGHGHEALHIFEVMRNAGISPNEVTFTCVLKACGIVRSLKIGEGIAAVVSNQGFLHKDVILGTAMVDMYAKCGVLDKAQEIFEQLPVRNVVTWNALIGGYADHGFGHEALNCFKHMRFDNAESVCPNEVTYICILKACGIVKNIDIGEDIVAEIRNRRLLNKSNSLGTAMMDMYSKCGLLEKAQEVFEKLPVKDVVAWSSLIGGYVQNGRAEEALNCFRQMKEAGIFPDVVAYINVLKACGIAGSLEIGEEVDAEVRKQGLLQSNVVVGTAVVDMYAKCGGMEKSREVFEQLPVRNVVSWSALIGGYAEHGLGDEALNLFKKMQDARVCPNVVTYVCVLKACGIVGSLNIGEDIDTNVRKQGLLHKDVVLSTALLDMYSKCGVMEKATEVFEHIPVREVTSWNAFMTGYAQLGQAMVVLNLYKQMKTESIMPNSVTFVVLLTACSHAGLLEDGEKLFDEMCAICCLTPTLEHYICMIDVFGRAGHFDKVKTMLEKVSSHHRNLPLFLTVLSACRKWGNVKLGNWAFEQSIKLNDKYGAAYICMQNIYTTSGMQMEANRIEALRMKSKAWIDDRTILVD